MATAKKTEEVNEVKEVKQEGPKMVRIRLPRPHENKGKGRHITVNNYDVFIPYGEEVEVPDFVVEVIENNARQDEATYLKIAQLEEGAQKF